MNTTDYKTLLAIDFGLARTGVAVGTKVTGARPLKVIASKTNEQRWQGLDELIQTWQPDELVLGVPYHGDGSANELTARCLRFARQLQGRYHKKVHLVDERYSSVSVDQACEEVDDWAASVILEQFFNSLSE